MDERAVDTLDISSERMIALSEKRKKEVEIWQLARHPRKIGTLGEYLEPVTRLAFSPTNPNILVTITESDGGVRIWSLEKDEKETHLYHNIPKKNLPDKAKSLAFSPNGLLFIGHSMGWISLWHLMLYNKPQHIGTWSIPEKKSEDVSSLAYLKDGRLFYSTKKSLGSYSCMIA